MLQILAHPNLTHKLILVPVHAGQGTDMSEDILQSIGQLEGVDVPKAELDVSVHDQLGQSENFSAQMEGIAEAGFLAFLRRQRLYWLQVHVLKVAHEQNPKKRNCPHSRNPNEGS